MTDDPSKKILITAGIVPDILESLVTAITFISFGMFCILYFPYLYLGYGHLLTMILVTIAFCFIRRLRINQLLMIGLHLVFGAAFLFLLHIIFFQFLKNDITNTIFVGIIIFVLFIFSILKRYRRRIERSTFDSVVVALCVHVFMLLGSTFGAIPVDLSTILFDAILIVILYLSGRQLSVFESSYYHNLHSSTQPIHSIKRQNYISLLYLFGGVLFALFMLVLVPINPILSTLSKVMPLIGKFFGWLVDVLFSWMSDSDLESSGQEGTPIQDKRDTNVDSITEIISAVIVTIFVIAIAFVLFRFLVLGLRNIWKKFHLAESDEKVIENENNAVIDIIEKTEHKKVRKKHLTRDFGTGEEAKIRKRYYQTVTRAIHAGVPIKDSSSPRQIEKLLKEKGDPSISELTSQYESVRYNKRED
ncbi:MAG: hypothetical protein K6A81_05625 [Clostridiales bacterium]|nr:hypothetical protein [Clostridiales bacterium]